MKNIRTRFAPSPTGYMHVGGVRTALFAWLVARKDKSGKLILRLEDTDQKREVKGSDEHLMRCLKTLGISYDEGPDIGGPYAPYRQSERLDIYKKWAKKLIDSNRAYADPYSSEEIQSFREQAKKENRAFLYRNHRPDNPPEWNGTMPLRFKSDPKEYKWHDEIMGDMNTGPEVIDDFILIKSDGFPTYNFAHIVDDAEMKVTHIIRGQEFISSQPNYLNLYEALNIERPILASVPPILGESGTKKLGKRDGAKDVLDYLKDGYLVEAMINFIASLGWNDGTEQEIFSYEELIDKFSLDRVQHSGARFDEKRLLWMNSQWIRKLTLEELYKRCDEFWPDSVNKVDEKNKMTILKLVQDRLKTLRDLPILTSYFFENPVPDWTMVKGNKQLGKLSKEQIIELLIDTKKALKNSDFDSKSIQDTLNELLASTNQKPAILFSLIRLAVSWAPFSPALNDTLSALGKDKTISRLQTAIETC